MDDRQFILIFLILVTYLELRLRELPFRGSLGQVPHSSAFSFSRARDALGTVILAVLTIFRKIFVREKGHKRYTAQKYAVVHGPSPDLVDRDTSLRELMDKVLLIEASGMTFRCDPVSPTIKESTDKTGMMILKGVPADRRRTRPS